DSPVTGTLRPSATCHLACRIATRRFNLYDVRTQVAEKHRAERTRHDLGNVQDTNPTESSPVGVLGCYRWMPGVQRLCPPLGAFRSSPCPRPWNVPRCADRVCDARVPGRAANVPP